MPSPFPGMDPYVERGDIWPELHNRLMVYVCDALQPMLPAHYVARLELRIYTERGLGLDLSAPRVPDLEVVRTPSRGGGAAVLSRDTAADEQTDGFWIPSPPVERREVAIGIRSMPDAELVTAVELLSPANKEAGAGRQKYVDKQTDVLEAGRNLVEIDLLRSGLHTVAVREEAITHLPSYDYLLCVYRSARPLGFWVKPWTIRARLPVLPIPLSAGDSELRIELQPLFDLAYDRAAIPKLVNYQEEPEPRLAPKDAAWADNLLRKAGYRGDTRA